MNSSQIKSHKARGPLLRKQQPASSAQGRGGEGARTLFVQHCRDCHLCFFGVLKLLKAAGSQHFRGLGLDLSSSPSKWPPVRGADSRKKALNPSNQGLLRTFGLPRPQTPNRFVFFFFWGGGSSGREADGALLHRSLEPTSATANASANPKNYATTRC